MWLSPDSLYRRFGADDKDAYARLQWGDGAGDCSDRGAGSGDYDCGRRGYPYTEKK